MTIGDRIKALRLQQPNYSQLNLAKDAGLTPAAISQYESNNRTPNAEALQKIASALKVSTDYLLGDDTINFEDKEDEQVLFRTITKLTDDDKKQVADFIDFLANKKGKK